MLHFPRHPSLIEQTAEALRRNLAAGAWADCLPPERELSDAMHVSRPTLRLALVLLRQQGLVHLSERPRRWVVAPAARRRAGRSSDLVQLISCDQRTNFSRSMLLHLGELQQRLQDAGLRLDVTADLRLRDAAPDRLLEQLAARVHPCCWILHLAPPPVQRWFAIRHAPAVVKGTCVEEVAFPSMDWDYQALTHHAVGQFVRLGHRRIAMVRPQRSYAGEEAREQGFLQACAREQRAGVLPRIVRHDGSAGQIQSLLRPLLLSPTRPTALLVSESAHALSVLSLCLGEGLAISRDVSLVCCDDEDFLRFALPSVARYTVDDGAYARRFSRLVLRIAGGGQPPLRPIRVVPRFLAGATLGPAPA